MKKIADHARMILSLIFVVAGFFLLTVEADAQYFSSTKTYGKDAFPAPYSNGVISLGDATSVTVGGGFTHHKLDESRGPCYKAVNTAKKSNTYVIYKNAAFSGNKKYDVKVYFWGNHTDGYMVTKSGRMGAIDHIEGQSTDKNTIIRSEFHVLEAGTNKEVTFHGVTMVDDLDYNKEHGAESWQVVQGGKGAWLSSDTKLEQTSKGWFRKKNMGATESGDVTTSVWFSYTCSAAAPLKLAYDCRDGYGSGLSADTVSITYKLAASSDYQPNTTVYTQRYHAKYGVYDVESPQKVVTKYRFEGWYSDTACTKKVTSYSPLKKNLTLYGKYIELFTVQTSITNGTITATEKNIEPGSSRTVTWKANSGYYISSVVIDGRSQSIASEAGGSYTFKNLSADHNVAVKALPYWTVTTSITNGTITPGDNRIHAGEDRTITYQAAEGYYIGSVIVDGKSQPIPADAGGSYTFNNINGNHSIVVKAVPYWTVTTSITNGTITPGDSRIHAGEDRTITYQAKEGYYVDSVLVDGESQPIPADEGGSYTFSNINGNHSIVVKALPYWSVRTSAEHASITPSDTKIHAGEDRTITYQADEGYYINSVVVDGKEQPVPADEGGSYTFRNITADHEITVKALPYWHINTSINNGKITPDDPFIHAGEDRTVTYEPDEGYYISKIEVDGREKSVKDYQKKYEFRNIQGNHEVVVTCRLIPRLQITKNVDKEQYNYQDTIQYSISLEQTVKGTVADGVVLEDKDLTKGIVINKNSIEVQCEKEETVYELVKKERSFEVRLPYLEYGNKITVHFEATVENDVLEAVDVENIAVATADNGELVDDSAMTGIYYRIETAVQNGMITESEWQIERGEHRTISYAPDEGYYLYSLSVDGNPLDVKKYPKHIRINDIRKNHNVEAVFAKIPSVRIEKKADKKAYHPEELVEYTLIVSQPVKGATAKGVVVKDTDFPEGLNLLKGSVRTDHPFAEVSYTESGFQVDIPEITNETPVHITFQAALEEQELLSSKITNRAGVSCENTSDRSEDQVTVEVFHTVYTEVENGAITPTMNRVKQRASKKVEYTPEEGYFLASVSVDGKEMDTSDHTESVMLKEIVSDRKVKAVYEPVPELQITKKSDKNSYQKGEVIRYTVTVENTKKDSLAAKLKLTDTGLSEGVNLLFESIVCDRGHITVPEGENGFSVLLENPLKYGESVRVTYQAVINEYAVLTSIRNVVSAKADGMEEPVTAENVAEMVVPKEEKENKDESEETPEKKPVKEKAEEVMEAKEVPEEEAVKAAQTGLSHHGGCYMGVACLCSLLFWGYKYYKKKKKNIS